MIRSREILREVHFVAESKLTFSDVKSSSRYEWVYSV